MLAHILLVFNLGLAIRGLSLNYSQKKAFIIVVVVVVIT
jgi:VanZ family protein